MLRIAMCVLSLVLFALATDVIAQEFRGAISGEVRDPSGAPVEGAKVTITSLERNTSTETTTNSEGRYTVQFLLPGSYQLAVEKSGFKRFVREKLMVASADRLGLNITLELGNVTETITVTSQAPVLQTETASRMALVENRVLENIPTNGRNLYQLQYTLPGVIKNYSSRTTSSTPTTGWPTRTT